MVIYKTRHRTSTMRRSTCRLRTSSLGPSSSSRRGDVRSGVKLKFKKRAAQNIPNATMSNSPDAVKMIQNVLYSCYGASWSSTVWRSTCLQSDLSKSTWSRNLCSDLLRDHTHHILVLLPAQDEMGLLKESKQHLSKHTFRRQICN